MARPKKGKISDELVYETILALCAAAGEADSVRPEDVAMELNPLDWQSLLKRVRLFAKQLAEDGLIVILRKGKPVDDLDEVKGIIKLRIAPAFFEPESPHQENN
jgi:hypothetical protein